MKLSTSTTVLLALIASATAFSPQTSKPTPVRLHMAEYNQEGMKGQRSGDEKHQDMWEAQQELLEHRREHSSSKEERMEKYSDPDDDKHGELLEPWTKDNQKDDHNSKRRKD